MLDKMARELGVAVPQLTSDARQKLSTYSYPGNVRELENILERAVALSGDEPIAAGDIQIRDSMGAANSEAALVTPEAGEPDVTGNVLGHQLETVERTAIINALEETRHNKTAAARNLGLTLRALRYRMQKLGIE
jgi:two-component system response regulator PilR (NtrC family)